MKKLLTGLLKPFRRTKKADGTPPLTWHLPAALVNRQDVADVQTRAESYLAELEKTQALTVANLKRK